MSYTPPESTSHSRDISTSSQNYGRQGSSHLEAFPISLPADFSTRDIPELQRLHAQMTVDNLRLWECLNIIRCNRRVNGIDILYDVFSMTDKEFFTNYPAYAGYEESGSGALRNIETSGSNHSERYLQHLVMHNNRLILENGRLYVCIEMLSSDSCMIPDEVVCHIFALSEEEFSRRYPSIGIGNRIRKLLAKLHEETRGRQQRSLSLPLHSYHRFVSTLGPSLHSFSSGPSCSNNNEHISPFKTLDDSFPMIGLSSHRSWPFRHVTNSKGDINSKRQPKQRDNLFDTPPSPPRLIGHEFSSVARSSPPRSSFKLPSPQRQAFYVCGRDLRSAYSDNVQPRQACQSLAKAPVQRQVQRRRSLSPCGQSRAKSNNAVVPDDEYVDDGGHFDDDVDESDDYDDGVAYKRKNRSVLSSRDKDTAGGRKREVTKPLSPLVGSHLYKSNGTHTGPGDVLGRFPQISSAQTFKKERKDASNSLDLSQTNYRSLAVPNKGLSRKDSSLHVNSCRKDPPISENLLKGTTVSLSAKRGNGPTSPRHVDSCRKDPPMSENLLKKDSTVNLSAKRSNSPTSPRSRGDNFSSQSPRLRASWSAGQTVGSRKSVPVTRNDRSCSPRYKTLEGETRGRRGFLQWSKKPSVSMTTTRTSSGDQTRYGSFKPLIVRHDFLPAAVNDTRRISVSDEPGFQAPDKCNSRAMSTSPRSSERERCLLSRTAQESRQQLMELRDVFRRYSSFSPKLNYLNRRHLTDDLSIEQNASEQGHLDLERLTSSSQNYSKFKCQPGSEEWQSPSSLSMPMRSADGRSRVLSSGNFKSGSQTDLRRYRSLSRNALSSDRRSKERRSSDSLDFGRRFKSPTEQAKWLPSNNNAFTRVYCSNSSSDEDSTRQLGDCWRNNSMSSNRTGKIPDHADRRVDSCKTTPSPRSTSAKASSIVGMPRSVSDLQIEIGRSRSFREGRCKKVEDAIQDLYELFAERSQKVKHSRVSSASPCRRYTHVLDSSQNRLDDDSPGDGSQQPERRDRSPAQHQPQEAGDSNPPPCLLGEIGFQLERRIIQMVFGDEPPKNLPSPLINEDEAKEHSSQRHRFYGYTVRNLPERIRAECRRRSSGERDGVREANMKCKFRRLIQELRDFGYSVTRHSSFAQDIINKYGLFSQPPDDATIAKYGLRDFRCVREHVIRMSEQNEREDLLVLLNCLHQLGRKVGKALLSFD